MTILFVAGDSLACGLVQSFLIHRFRVGQDAEVVNLAKPPFALTVEAASTSTEAGVEKGSRLSCGNDGACSKHGQHL